MKKIKRVFAVIICFAMLLSMRPVYAAESRIFNPPCSHTAVYITGEDISPQKVDDDYHCLRSQEVTKCVQCDAVISRGQIVLGDLKHHHFTRDDDRNIWVCDECGATRGMP